MRQFLATILLCLVLTPACAAERPARGFADDLLGRWDLRVAGDDGEYPSWVELRLRTEWQLMARFVGRFGSTRYTDDVEFADGRLRLRVPVQYEPGPGALEFEGELRDGGLAGTLIAPGAEAVPFTGERAPALERAGVPEAGNPLALFDGVSLSGWRPRHAAHAGCWQVADGVLRATPPCVDLVSVPRFDDFRLEVELRYPAGSNSGLYLRGRYELQIQDDHGLAVDPLRMGGVYGFIAAATNAARPAGAWQRYDVELRGRRVTVALNGTTVIAGSEIPGITGGALDAEEAEPGPLMLQGDHGPIEFRRIVLTPLE